MPGRLRRSDCSGSGLGRIRRGRGFSYTDEEGGRIEDRATLARLRELAIPPAWRDVWICPDPLGHLQATGIDAAGRKQYLYHERWRQRRDQQKFERMLRFARRLPRLRRRVAAALDSDEVSRERVLAGAVRLLDVGLFRIGSEEYAEVDHSFGLATVYKEHVRVSGTQVVFDYPAKGGAHRLHVIEDPLSHPLITALKRRRGGGAQLLAYRDGRRWLPVRSGDINDYLKAEAGDDYSAKDFRTWNATVLAAVSLAAVSLAADAPKATSKTARKRNINMAVRGVAEMLGNTPAVARRSYIDPGVFDRYLSGWTIAGALGNPEDLGTVDDRERARLERAVIDLLREDEDSSALTQHLETAVGV
jgi:DNA topoisomerase I